MTLLWLALGALLALPYLAVGRRLTGRRARLWWSGGLAVAALVYVVLALLAGTRGTVLLVESIGAVAFVGLSTLGVRGNRAWVAAGWLLHAGWDLSIQSTLGVAPSWYVWACVAFDVVVGVALYLEAVRR